MVEPPPRFAKINQTDQQDEIITLAVCITIIIQNWYGFKKKLGIDKIFSCRTARFRAWVVVQKMLNRLHVFYHSELMRRPLRMRRSGDFLLQSILQRSNGPNYM